MGLLVTETIRGSAGILLLTLRIPVLALYLVLYENSRRMNFNNNSGKFTNTKSEYYYQFHCHRL